MTFAESSGRSGRARLSEDEIAHRVAAERERLLRQAGLPTVAPIHFHRPIERPLTREQRERVTILHGGLTFRHDKLILAGMQGLGYKVGLVPIPTKADFQTGKEFGNNGQCNPTYFTVGCLVNHLRHMRDVEGIPTDRIISDYCFVTAGTCGPCRFGMYEAEYRLALRNAGFDGFRVLTFDQEGGLAQTAADAGIEMNVPFFLTFLNACFIGDLLNAVAQQIRPYELVAGRTDEVVEQCLEICQDALRTKPYASVKSGSLARWLRRLRLVKDAEGGAIIVDQLLSPHYLDALDRCRALIEQEIEVDYTRVKPIVKVTGEFWAQTTEGEGNFRMFEFLEREGAEALVEPVATWADYMITQARLRAEDRRGLAEGRSLPKPWEVAERTRRETAFRKRSLAFRLAKWALGREYDRMRLALGGTVHRLANQLELQRVAHPFYNTRSDGGEGHLEVAKNIYYLNHRLAHMVLSLKPFGCMPSTQSDGAQAAVISHYPDMIYLPVETSGEGDINAYSRVQMALGEAKTKAKAEFRQALERTGYALDEIRRYVAEHRELRRPIAAAHESTGVVGRAAGFVTHVASLMDRDPAWVGRKRHAALAG